MIFIKHQFTRVYHFCLLFMAGCLISQGLSAQEYTISGYVKDASNGEALIGATVLVKELGTGQISNVYGFYSITIPEGKYTIEYRFIGFEVVTRTIDLTQNQRIDVELSEAQTELEEVVVTAESANANITNV